MCHLRHPPAHRHRQNPPHLSLVSHRHDLYHLNHRLCRRPHCLSPCIGKLEPWNRRVRFHRRYHQPQLPRFGIQHCHRLGLRNITWFHPVEDTNGDEDEDICRYCIDFGCNVSIRRSSYCSGANQVPALRLRQLPACLSSSTTRSPKTTTCVSLFPFKTLQIF